MGAPRRYLDEVRDRVDVALQLRRRHRHRRGRRGRRGVAQVAVRLVAPEELENKEKGQ